MSKLDLCGVLDRSIAGLLRNVSRAGMSGRRYIVTLPRHSRSYLWLVLERTRMDPSMRMNSILTFIAAKLLLEVKCCWLLYRKYFTLPTRCSLHKIVVIPLLCSTQRARQANAYPQALSLAILVGFWACTRTMEQSMRRPDESERWRLS